MTQTDTIAAIATPLGTAGLGIIRVSGPMASEMGQLLFRPHHQNCTWQSHHLYHGDIVADDGATLLDEVLVTLMRKPHSFTGEDVLEISCHGNPLILQTILEQLIILGCRPARPGEFSQRAYLNGRMDLSQAEALASMISAQSSKALKIGLAQMKGSLGREINSIRTMVIDALAGIEAAIDFTEDVSGHETTACPPQIHEAMACINRLLSTYRQEDYSPKASRLPSPANPMLANQVCSTVLSAEKSNCHQHSRYHPGPDYGNNSAGRR